MTAQDQREAIQAEIKRLQAKAERYRQEKAKQYREEAERLDPGVSPYTPGRGG